MGQSSVTLDDSVAKQLPPKSAAVRFGTWPITTEDERLFATLTLSPVQQLFHTGEAVNAAYSGDETDSEDAMDLVNPEDSVTDDNLMDDVYIRWEEYCSLNKRRMLVSINDPSTRSAVSTQEMCVTAPFGTCVHDKFCQKIGENDGSGGEGIWEDIQVSMCNLMEFQV